MKKINIIIDNKKIQVSDKLTLLQAAELQNINIPSLCYLEGYEHTTSCMLCMVWDNMQNKLIPSCSVNVKEGMNIITNNERVQEIRKSSLEFLLAEHMGDCVAPCQQICPAHPHIPQMIREIRTGQTEKAYKTIKEELIFPAVLGYICPAPCETGCRRNQFDSGISICKLHRLTAVTNEESTEPYQPKPKSKTGKHIAVIGAGPAGLAGAYTLYLDGHKVTVFEQNNKAGGSLYSEKKIELLPEDTIEKEIQTLLLPGINLKFGKIDGRVDDIHKLKKDFDAVLLCIGKQEISILNKMLFKTGKGGISVNSDTFESSIQGVFAAGSIIKDRPMVVTLIAEGKEAARSISRIISQKQTNSFEAASGDSSFANAKNCAQFFTPSPQKLRHSEFPAGHATELVTSRLDVNEHIKKETRNLNSENTTKKQVLFNSRMGKLSEEEIKEYFYWSENSKKLMSDKIISLTVNEAVQEAKRCFGCDCKKAFTCKLRKMSSEHSSIQPRTLLNKHKKFEILTGFEDQNRQSIKLEKQEVINSKAEKNNILFEPGKCIKCGLCLQTLAGKGHKIPGLTFNNRGFEVVLKVPFDHSFDNALGVYADECIKNCPTSALSKHDHWEEENE